MCAKCYPCVYKTCASCKQAKPLSEFSSNPDSPDDLNASCDKCVRKIAKSRKRTPSRRRSAVRCKMLAAVKVTHKKCGTGGRLGCGQVLPAGDFNLWGRSADGLRHICRACEIDYERKLKSARHAKDPLLYWAKKIKVAVSSVCSSKREPCDITVQWCLEQIEDETCAQTGLPLDLSFEDGPRSPSVDRIDPLQPGHRQANCRVVMQWINFAKHDYGPEEFDKLLCQIPNAPKVRALAEQLSLTSPPSSVPAPSAGGQKAMDDDEWKSTILSVAQAGSMTDDACLRSAKTVTRSSIRARR